MQLRERKDPVCGESLFEGEAACGLAVKVMPRPGFARTSAQIAIDYGSVDRRFVVNGGKRPMTVPSGVAHFLEHKMFEKERGDLFNEFSRLGASANAFTGHLSTSYVFSTSGEVAPCLDILLELVFVNHFTDALVEKEMGIIDEEIRGYDDSAGWRAYRGVLENLYRKHHVREDIAGTSETIRKITAKTLRAIHDGFYVPRNSVLCVAGPVDPAEIMAGVDAGLGTKKDPRSRPETVAVDEPAAVKRRRATLQMPVAMPILNLGFKGPGAKNGAEAFRLETAGSIALDLLLGETTAFHEDAYAEGLIGDDFSSTVRADESMTYSLIGGQTPDPKALEKRVLETLESGLAKGLARADMERVRRRVLGDFVRLLDSTDGLCNHLADCHRSNLDLFALPDAVAKMSPALVRSHGKRLFDPSRVTSVTIVPPAET